MEHPAAFVTKAWQPEVAEAAMISDKLFGLAAS
jgi:hypothetical protein